MMTAFAPGTLIMLARNWRAVELRSEPTYAGPTLGSVHRDEHAVVLACFFSDVMWSKVNHPGADILVLTTTGCCGWAWSAFDPDDDLCRFQAVS